MKASISRIAQVALRAKPPDVILFVGTSFRKTSCSQSRASQTESSASAVCPYERYEGDAHMWPNGHHGQLLARCGPPLVDLDPYDLLASLLTHYGSSNPRPMVTPRCINVEDLESPSRRWYSISTSLRPSEPQLADKGRMSKLEATQAPRTPHLTQLQRTDADQARWS